MLLVEHRMRRPADGFVLAICYVKYRVVSQDKSLTAAKVLAAIDGANVAADGSTPPPPAPRDAVAWLEYDQLSSAALRAEAGI